jgi:hypothetical protein
MKDHLWITFGVDNIFDYRHKVIYNVSVDESAANIYALFNGRYISINAEFKY